jgi:hypothetical protein
MRVIRQEVDGDRLSLCNRYGEAVPQESRVAGHDAGCQAPLGQPPRGPHAALGNAPRQGISLRLPQKP